MIEILNIIAIGLPAYVLYYWGNKNSTCIKNTLVNVSYNIVHTYSRLEIIIKNIVKNKNVQYFLNKIEEIQNYSKGDIEIIDSNKVLFSTKIGNLYSHFPLNYNFIIYTDREIKKNKPYNKVIFYNIPQSIEYKLCDFHMISIYITIKFSEIKYKIDLLTETENYYIVNNRINKLLLCYLLKKQYGIILDEINCEYTLDIIDQNVNFKNFTEKDEIILYETNYEVINYVHRDVSNLTLKQQLMSEEEREKESNEEKISDHIIFTIDE